MRTQVSGELSVLSRVTVGWIRAGLALCCMLVFTANISHRFHKTLVNLSYQKATPTVSSEPGF